MSDALMWHTERARSIRANREVGAAIRFARENRGWRLADLAAQVGYSVSTISRLETSRREPTDLAQIRGSQMPSPFLLMSWASCSACRPLPGLRWTSPEICRMRRMTCAAVSCLLQASSFRLFSWLV